MLLAVIAIIVGFVALVWSADRFVAGSAATARNLGMAPIMIGLTIVSLGTSAPEIIVSGNAALSGASDLGVGNAIGSNLANIGMVLAITALIAPIPIRGSLLKRDLPLLLAATALGAACLWDHHLSRLNGVLLLGGMITVLCLLIYGKSHGEHAEEEVHVEDIPTMSKGRAWTWLFIGLICLIASSEVLVWGAKTSATELGVSPLIIGLTIIAVGTSLPELAASVASALKGHHDIALGNVIGSNMFNIMAVMAVPALIMPPQLDASVLNRDYAAMTALTALLALMLVILIKTKKSPRIGRSAGILMLAFYGYYYYLLFPM